MFEKDRIREDLSPQRQIAYRMEAETLIGPDETLYRVEWVSSAGL